jgi:hypothetical protein
MQIKPTQNDWNIFKLKEIQTKNWDGLGKVALLLQHEGDQVYEKEMVIA